MLEHGQLEIRNQAGALFRFYGAAVKSGDLDQKPRLLAATARARLSFSSSLLFLYPCPHLSHWEYISRVFNEREPSAYLNEDIARAPLQ